MAIWSLSAIYGHPRLAPHGAPCSTTTQDRNTGPGGEATAHVRTYTRGRAAVDTRGGRHDVPCRPQDRHTVGEGRQTDLDPHAGGTPAVPGDRGSCTARGDSAAALRVIFCRLRQAGARREPPRVNTAALDRWNGGSAPVAECRTEDAARQGIARQAHPGRHVAGAGPLSGGRTMRDRGLAVR